MLFEWSRIVTWGVSTTIQAKMQELSIPFRKKILHRKVSSAPLNLSGMPLQLFSGSLEIKDPDVQHRIRYETANTTPIWKGYCCLSQRYIPTSLPKSCRLKFRRATSYKIFCALKENIVIFSTDCKAVRLSFLRLSFQRKVPLNSLTNICGSTANCSSLGR